ncbi:MAG: DUF1844 domain-containing protein [Candidatus Omnitrophica bacterium]|nr:DUF1844 domain-containing protein [Candidatus Omnitrophota bacterium]
MENDKVTFTGFLSGIAAEGMMALGMIENPVTKKTEKNLGHAGSVVDLLEVIKLKTQGNRTREEDKLLDDILHQLRMAYVSFLESKDAKPEAEKTPETNG